MVNAALRRADAIGVRGLEEPFGMARMLVMLPKPEGDNVIVVMEAGARASYGPMP